MSRKIQPCLWFNKNAEEAAHFYAKTFPDSRIDSVERAPGDYPSGKSGDVLVSDARVPADVAERFFTLGFALEQMRQNLKDLERCAAHWSDSSTVTTGDPSDAAG